ncbi:hypothetical protein R3P38DRAFT_2804734 [Favolaschia claudopus]|uniref:DUF7923 domain-containing protein n=1 Tax=Favolaschia claudopus TaxID=2862362 RepID=A0AAV9ZPJ8_9AGAR
MSLAFAPNENMWHAVIGDLQSRNSEETIKVLVCYLTTPGLFNTTTSENTALKLQVADMEREVAGVLALKNSQRPMFLCVINGDLKWFNGIYQGHFGGQLAAQSLVAQIASYINAESAYDGVESQIWITVYYNKNALLQWLLGGGKCTVHQIEDFIASMLRHMRSYVSSHGFFLLAEAACVQKLAIKHLLRKLVLIFSAEEGVTAHGLPFVSVHGNLFLSAPHNCASTIYATEFQVSEGKKFQRSP